MTALVVNPDKSEGAQLGSCLIDSDLQAKLTETAYRVPVLRLDWFWKSLQSTYICHPQDFLYIHDTKSSDSPHSSYFTPQRASGGVFSIAHLLGKENEQPDPNASGTELPFQSCLSPTGRLGRNYFSTHFH